MIFVTGGTGFLGSYLIKFLIREGKKVRALRRPSSSMNLLGDFEKEVEWVEGDILDVTVLHEACEGVEQVYHSAAMISFVPKKRYQMMKINVEGTANVVNACLNTGVQKLMHVSSISAFGRTKSDTVIDEEFEWKEAKDHTNYAICKHLSEHEIWRGYHEGLKSVIVNPATILGAGNWTSGPGLIFNKIWNGLSFYPKGMNGYVDVRDVVQTMIQIMNSSAEGEKFILNAENIYFKDLFFAIADELKKKRPSIKLNKTLGLLARIAESISSFISGNDPIVTRETLRSTQREFRYSNEKTRKFLNYEFMPMKQTIEETCAVFLESQNEGKNFGVFF